MTESIVRARAALAGNPSDGYEGAVVSIPVPTLLVRASVTRGPRSEELVAATIARFEREVVAVNPDVTIRFETTIPRSVGLAGSSAIVIATLRQLLAHTGTSLANDRISEMAHAIERTDLGIAGGWQDQLCQVAGVPLLMEFAPPRMTEELHPGRHLPLFVAWDPELAEASGASHAELRRAVDPRTPAMHELAALARSSAKAFSSGDVHGLKEAMSATLDIRFALMAVHPAHRQMAETVAALGAPCNFAGSGGAVVGIVPKDPEPFFASLHAAGLHTTQWEIGQ